MSTKLKILSIAVIVLIICIITKYSDIASNNFGKIDFSEYWAGGNLLLQGKNPYDHSLMFEIEKRILPNVNLPIILWCTPIVFPFIVPFSMLPFNVAVVLWFILSIICVVEALKLLTKDRIYSSKEKLLTLIIILSFYPIGLCFYYGQISSLLLLSLALFLKRNGNKKAKQQI